MSNDGIWYIAFCNNFFITTHLWFLFGILINPISTKEVIIETYKSIVEKDLLLFFVKLFYLIYLYMSLVNFE